MEVRSRDFPGKEVKEGGIGMKKRWEILLVLLVAAELLTSCQAQAPQEEQDAC